MLLYSLCNNMYLSNVNKRGADKARYQYLNRFISKNILSFNERAQRKLMQAKRGIFLLGNREREPALNKSFLSRYMHQIEGTEGLRIFYLDVQTKYYYYCIKPWIDFITAMEDQIYTLSLFFMSSTNINLKCMHVYIISPFFIQGLRAYSGWGVEYIDTLFGHKRMKYRMNAGIFKYLCGTTTDHFSN